MKASTWFTSVSLVVKAGVKVGSKTPPSTLRRNTAGHAANRSVLKREDEVIDLPGCAATRHTTVVQYGATGVADQGSNDPQEPGVSFHAGGAHGENSLLCQTIDVGILSTHIDFGSVELTLNGYLDGRINRLDSPTLTAEFLDAANDVLRSARVDPVPRLDHDSTTGLIICAVGGNIPCGTRSVRLVLTCAETAGNGHDRRADDPSLALSDDFHSRIDRDVGIEWNSTAGTRYQVQHSPDLTNWVDVGESVTATSAITSIHDHVEVHPCRHYRVIQIGEMSARSSG